MTKYQKKTKYDTEKIFDISKNDIIFAIVNMIRKKIIV